MTPLKLGLFLLCCLATAAQAVEIVQWQRLPIAVPLQVGKERIVFVDQNVRVGMPRSLKSRLRLQSNAGALYLRASEVIEPTRLQLQNVESGEIMLIDIAAAQVANDAPELESLKIVKHPHAVETAAAESGVTDQPAAATPIPVVLSRYAAQNLYAPLRTVEPLAGVNQVRVHRQLDLSALLPSLPVNASVLGAWQMEDFWATAVKLQNRSTADLQLDPRLLQGRFIAATFQHQTLGTQGSPSDTTTVYLVTRGSGLAEALPPAMSQVDAARDLLDARGARDEK
jgi:integrating conjugative element protein (TIGR03749 family)